MPLYNVRMTIRRNVAGNQIAYNMPAYVPATATANPVNWGSVLTRPFLEQQLESLGYLVMRGTDRNEARPFDLLGSFRGQVRFIMVAAADPTRWVQVVFSIVNVVTYQQAFAEFVRAGSQQFRISGLRVVALNPSRDDDVFVMVDRTRTVSLTHSTALGLDLLRAPAAILNVPQVFTLEPITAVAAGFELDTWGRFVSATRAVEFLAVTSRTEGQFSEVSTRVLDCRYDARIATGQVATIDDEHWRIVQSVEIESRRVLRLSLEKIVE